VDLTSHQSLDQVRLKKEAWTRRDYSEKGGLIQEERWQYQHPLREKKIENRCSTRPVPSPASQASGQLDFGPERQGQ
jgi:hypothetical protein